jgi:hypothetical protein
MTKCKLFLFFFLSITLQNLSAQSDDQMKLDNLKYYMSSAKDNVESMRYYTDSTKIIELLDQMNGLLAQLDMEVNKIVLPEVSADNTVIETTEPEPATEDVADVPAIEGDIDYNAEGADGQDGQDGLNLSKFMPFKKKINTGLKIGFGINALHAATEVPSGVLSPEINTGGSWYWDFGLVRSARLGGKNSKVAFNYGISFLKNRFKLDNDVRLIKDMDGNPLFVNMVNVKGSPKLNVGYLNVPISFTFALSKNSKLEIGGYAGYRIHTVQKAGFKVDKERIDEQRYSRNELNNWIYGGSVGIDFNGFDIIAKYNFSKLFNDNPRYDFNTFMIGTSVTLF